MFLNKSRFNPFAETGVPAESDMNRATRQYFSSIVKRDKLVTEKAKKVNLQANHKKALELSLVITLTGFILLSHFIKGVDFVTRAVDVVDVKIEVADIPQTKQLRKPPPPARPSLPVPTEDDMVPEDLTIASTELDLTDIPAPPPPPVDDEMPIFVAYDEPPLIIGGLQSLMTHLRYPRLAQAASVEGIVYVKILVGSDGSTEKVEIIKSTVSGMGFEDSAIDALNKVKWQPAKQRDRNIRVWVSMPVQFKLMS